MRHKYQAVTLIALKHWKNNINYVKQTTSNTDALQRQTALLFEILGVTVGGINEVLFESCE